MSLPNISYQSVGPEYEDTRWLELYVLYKMDGGPCVAKEETFKAAAKPSMRTQLKTFKAMVKEIARCTMSEDDAKVFSASQYRKSRLKSLGIESYSPMIRARINLEEEAKIEVAEHILKSQSGRNPKKARDLIMQGTAIRLQKFACTKRTGWSKTIRKFKGAIFKRIESQDQEKGEEQKKVPEEEAEQKGLKEKTEEAQAEVQEGGKKESTEEPFLLGCHRCGAKVRSDRKAFQQDTLGTKTRCRKCEKSWMAKTWICPCGIQWHTCEKHRYGQKTPQVKPEEKQASTRRQKRRPQKPLSADLEGLYSSKGLRAKTARRTGSEELVIRTGMLSTNLKRKFSHLCTD